MRITLLIFNFVLLILIFASSQANGQANIDSLESELKVVKDDSLKFDILIDLHNANFRKAPDESKKYALQMIALGEETQNLFRKYKGYTALNRYETKFRNYDVIIPNTKKLIAIAKELGNDEEIFAQILGLANNYIDAEKNDLVVPQLNLAMQLAKQNKSELQINKVNYSLGFFYHNTGQYSKSLNYLEKNIQTFKKLGDEKSLANAIAIYAESSLMSKPDVKTLNLLIVADNLNEKNESLYRQAYIRSLMGKYFVLNGKSNAAIENFDFARTFYSKHHNVVEYALVGIDKSMELLQLNKINQAKDILIESESIINKNNYTPGKDFVRFAWVEYYLKINQNANANKYLKQLHSSVKSNNDINLKIRYEQLNALLQMQTGNTTSANKAFFDYYKSLFKHKEKGGIVSDLNMLNRRQSHTDSTLVHIVNLIKSDEGFNKLKKYFSTSIFEGVILVDSLLIPIIDTLSNIEDTVLNEILGLSYDAHLETVDAVLNKNILKENLEKQMSNNQRNVYTGILISILLIVIIVILILYLRQSKLQKEKTEKDKKTIENLHIQLNHLVVNNLKSVGDFIDKAKEEEDLNKAIDSLKVRVDVVRNFYNIYKKQKIADQLDADKGVMLQQQFEDLISYFKVVNNVDNSWLKTSVNAYVVLDYNIGINLVLLLSELLQNSFKYAFENEDVDKINEINIDVIVNAANHLCLNYRDNGIGKILNHSKGLGSEIIKEIEATLNGIGEDFNENGYNYILQVKLKNNEYKKTKS